MLHDRSIQITANRQLNDKSQKNILWLLSLDSQLLTLQRRYAAIRLRPWQNSATAPITVACSAAVISGYTGNDRTPRQACSVFFKLPGSWPSELKHSCKWSGTG